MCGLKIDFTVGDTSILHFQGEIPNFEKGVAVVGGHFGDEGKGRYADDFVEEYKIEGYKVVNARFQGGGNAGHTVNRDGVEYHFHYLPSGALISDVVFLGAGMLINPMDIQTEINMLPEDQQKKVIVDERATVCTDVDKFMDGYYEAKRSNKVGTTGSGVGPAVSSRALRVHITFADAKKCENYQELLELFDKMVNVPNSVWVDIAKKYGSKDYFAMTVFEAIQKLNVVPGTPFLNKLKKEGYALVCEVSQAFGLDCIHGNSGHYVTSTHTTAIGALADGGLGINDLSDGICVVTKAYASKVGGGYFVTEFGHGGETPDDVQKLEDSIRKYVPECGVTTGRKRLLGWFDAVCVRAALQANGTKKLAINCMDVIGLIHGGIAKICYAYRHKKTGKIVYDWPYFQDEYDPVYIEVEVDFNIFHVTDENNLPDGVWRYLAYISFFTGAEIDYIGTGGASTDYVKFSENGKAHIRQLTQKIKELYAAIEETASLNDEGNVDPDDGSYGDDEKPTTDPNGLYCFALHSEDNTLPEKQQRRYLVYAHPDSTTGLLVAKQGHLEQNTSEDLKGFSDGNYEVPDKAREITPGSKWRHFKGSTSTIIGVARDAITGDYYVVYVCYGNAGKTNHEDGDILARPLDMFLSPNEKKDKYPDQDMRFEKID